MNDDTKMPPSPIRPINYHELEVMKLNRMVYALRTELARLRDLLDRRPALNAGTLDAYVKWTGEAYFSDMSASAAADAPDVRKAN